MRWAFLGLNIICFFFGIYAIVIYWPAEAFSLNDYILPIFLGTFCLFFLSISTYLLIYKDALKNTHKGIHTLTGFILILFVITCFYTARAHKESTIDYPVQISATIFKIDVTKINSYGSIYYRYSYNGQVFQDKFLGEMQKYQIGDTLLLLISPDYPVKNKIIKSE